MEELKRKCKECGKLFTPRGRERYCTDIHYRPCPACGKLVVARYLSDPARCCSKECQQEMRRRKNVKQPAKDTEVAYITPTVSDTSSLFTDVDSRYDYEDTLREAYTCATYRNPKLIMKFIPGHEYAIEISREKDNPYVVHALYDFTDKASVDLYIPISSRLSINRSFTKGEVQVNQDGTVSTLSEIPVCEMD